MHDRTVRIPEFYIEEGFREAKIEYFRNSPKLIRAINEQHLVVAEEFAESLIKLGKSDVASKYFRLIQEAYNESLAEEALCNPRIVCIVQKPM